jgi:hypothetical protein
MEDLMQYDRLFSKHLPKLMGAIAVLGLMVGYNFWFRGHQTRELGGYAAERCLGDTRCEAIVEQNYPSCAQRATSLLGFSTDEGELISCISQRAGYDVFGLAARATEDPTHIAD